VTGDCPTWIPTLAHRYNEQGPQGLGDRRHSNPGATFMLSQEQQAQLHQTLDEPPADGGLWTGPKVARWIESQTGRKVHPQRGWEYLKRLNSSKRGLRPRHAKADPAAQEAFKNPLRST
jgi:transposase